MSLSLRGLFLALPIVALIIGAMAWSIYSGSIDDDRANVLRELDLANRAAADALQLQISLIEETQHKATTSMAARLEEPGPTRFDDIFMRAPDGAFHTRDDLWSGSVSAGTIPVHGIGGFAPPPGPAGERRGAIVAAFEVMRQMVNGLPSRIESLYFFSPANDLLIYAPQRADQLSFYRTAPADLDFQGAEFSRITSPAENPQGLLRCTSLQKPIYDDSGGSWTTGCMLPVRVAGRHLGSWGVSIPLDQLTDGLTPPPEGASTIIVGRDGKLIHHSDAAAMDGDQLQANVDLASSGEPVLRAIWAHVENGIAAQTMLSEPLDAYVSARSLAAPDWVVLTVLPRQVLHARAWALAERVVLIALMGALALGLVLAAVFHRTVASRAARLVARIDRVSASDGASLPAGVKDEITQLEYAFDRLEDRLAVAHAREQRSFDALVDAADRYAMVLYDDHGRMVRASKGALDLFGERELRQLASEWGLTAEAAPKAASRATDRLRPRVVRRKLAGGREAWLEELIVPLLDNRGAPFGTAYIGQDITEAHDAQRTIEERLAVLELAQSTAQAGHFALDPKTMQLSISSWLRETFGVPGESLPLAQVADMIDESRREETMTAIALAIGSRSEFSFESVGIRADGSRVAVLVRGAAVFRDDGENKGELTGFYGMIQDITEQKEAAEALLRGRAENASERG